MPSSNQPSHFIPSAGAGTSPAPISVLFPEIFRPKHSTNLYSPVLTATMNGKGVLDVDTTKGCTLGMKAYPDGGCYGECYAYKGSIRAGKDFTVSISRKIMGREHRGTIIRMMNGYDVGWYRIGVSGDPCHDWNNTLVAIRALRHSNKVPVIITKHWKTLSDDQLNELRSFQAVINTSVSGLDTDAETRHRVAEIERIRAFGIKSITRVVTCNFGTSEWARACKEKQDYLLSLVPTINNPLRPCLNNPYVINGDIRVERRHESVGGGKIISLNCQAVYIGRCDDCPDQCGVDNVSDKSKHEVKRMDQEELFKQEIEFVHVPVIIGSGYEQDIATLALEDGIAHRAARKNMQIHSAIVLKIDDKFAGFMTFQNNHDVKEFCLLQSVIKPEQFTKELYREMVVKVIEQNTSEYPALITTDPKSKFETPALFESLGFVTYLKMSGFHYMIKGKLEDSRFKLLAHITMTNVWDSTKGEWLRIKKDWKSTIEDAGSKHGVVNPMYATREGCWQGENGFANVVTGHSHNSNASVLDPVVCEVALRFFMPTAGRRVYNPFGGGVQFGFITGSYGYEYVSSEIRRNQCDANNAICSDFPGVQWVKSDSSTYHPEGMFDLVFTCPPYFKVEKYLDYDGKPPEGELNSLPTYDEFQESLFSGYRIAIEHLNNNCFFVIMTGDSRDNKGAFYCSEAKTEVFLQSCGLSIYNRIVYVEGEFTRLAHAKKTLNTRKFPKREQKIIVAYKGDTSKIKDLYTPVGRL